MTPIATAFAARAVVTAALALGSFVAIPDDANALSLRVKLACAADYYKHCSAYSPGGSEVVHACGRFGPVAELRLGPRCCR